MNSRVLIGAIALTAASLAHAQGLILSSPDIADNRSLDTRQVYRGFGCEGGNVSPALSWSHAPAGTKSFAVTVYDPDAPTGSGWWHWSVFNLPATANGIPAAANSTTLPAGAVQGRSDYGTAQFGGACPPVGDKPHRYQFTVWALKVDKLPLDNQASGALVGYMLNANVLEKATLTPVYGR